jgi:hypothetical protein
MTTDAVLTRLRHALQALALPAETQLGLLPRYAGEVDDLILNFDHWFRAATALRAGSMTPGQVTALAEIERVLDQMSGQGNAHLWTRSAVRDDVRWSHLRRAAQGALRVFGWELAVPPATQYEFIAW